MKLSQMTYANYKSTIERVKEAVKQTRQKADAKASTQSQPAPRVQNFSQPVNPATKIDSKSAALEAKIDGQNTEIAALKEEIAALRGVAIEAAEKAERADSAPRRLKPLEIARLGIDVFGQSGLRRILSGKRESEHLEAVERYLFYSGVSIPGISFEHIETRFGARREMKGLLRIEAAELQQRVNASLAKLR